MLCRQYDAQQALDMGLVNTVVPLDELEAETVKWCHEMLALSPFALRLVKRAFTLRRTAWAGSSSSPTTPTCCSTPATRRRRAARPTRPSAPPDFAQFPKRLLSPLHIWLMAARPRTLPAAAAPVLVGTAYAATLGTFKPLTFIATLLGALLIQIGTNLSNDYCDARRGADTEDRLGPVRVTAGGLVPPKQVLIATYVAFGLAVLVGVYLIVTAGWQILLDRRRCRSSPACSTPAARARTGTKGSARSSCSCSSASSP